VGVAERLQGGGEIPWIPDEAKAVAYGKPYCGLNPLIGKAVGHYRRDNFRQDGQYDVVVLLVEGVGAVAVHCQATVLANQMRDARPKGGEEVGVQYLGMTTSAAGTPYANYKVVVDREVGGEFDWSDEEERPTSHHVAAHTPATVNPAQYTTTVQQSPPAPPVIDTMDDVPFMYTVF
jgi:hypothetical protein